MRDRMRELWDDVVPADAPCPQADPAAVKRRGNAALNAVPSERRTYMRQKIRFAAPWPPPASGTCWTFSTRGTPPPP